MLSFKQAFGGECASDVSLSSFAGAVVYQAVKGRGIAVSDLLSAVYERSLALDWPGRSVRALLPRLAEIE